MTFSMVLSMNKWKFSCWLSKCVTKSNLPSSSTWNYMLSTLFSFKLLLMLIKLLFSSDNSFLIIGVDNYFRLPMNCGNDDSRSSHQSLAVAMFPGNRWTFFAKHAISISTVLLNQIFSTFFTLRYNNVPYT